MIFVIVLLQLCLSIAADLIPHPDYVGAGKPWCYVHELGTANFHKIGQGVVNFKLNNNVYKCETWSCYKRDDLVYALCDFSEERPSQAIKMTFNDPTLPQPPGMEWADGMCLTCFDDAADYQQGCYHIAGISWGGAQWCDKRLAWEAVNAKPNP